MTAELFDKLTESATQILNRIGPQNLAVCAFYGPHHDSTINQTDPEIPRLLELDLARRRGFAV